MIYDLMFEGGGMRCAAFLGVLHELEMRGHTLGRLVGASAGGILAAMLACGYDSREATAALYDYELQQFTFARVVSQSAHTSPAELRRGHLRDLLRESTALPHASSFAKEQMDKLVFNLLLSTQSLRPLINFLELGYWYPEKPYLDWLSSLFSTGSFRGSPRDFSNMTLNEYYLATGSDLSLIVSDITDAHVLILNHRTAPYCPLVWALRMSSGVPLMWQAVTWQDAWGTYLERDITGHQIVDGELLSPFPIELLISDLPQVTQWIGPKQTTNVLGVVVDTTIPVPNAPAPQTDALLAAAQQLPSAEALNQIVDSFLLTRYKFTIQVVDQQIVRLPAKGYGMMEVQISAARLAAVVEAARSSTYHHFECRRSSEGQA